VLIIRRSKLYYTAAGIITPVGVMIPHAYYKTRFCASSWLIARIGLIKNTVMPRLTSDPTNEFFG